MVQANVRLAAAIAAAFLLSACSEFGGLTAESARGPIARYSGPPPLDPPSAPQPPRLVEVPPGTPANSSTQPISGTPAIAAVAPPAPAVNANPEQPLYGLPSTAVVAALGPAGFVRRDGPAEIWRYAAGPCFLDVFFYRESDGQKVNYVAARPRNAARPVTTDSCYRALLAERNGAAG